MKKKLTDHKHDEYITTPEFNKLTAEHFTARLKQANLVTKTDFANKLTNLNKKITSNKTNQLVTENELKKLKAFDYGQFVGKTILMKVVRKILIYFNQFLSTYK